MTDTQANAAHRILDLTEGLSYDNACRLMKRIASDAMADGIAYTTETLVDTAMEFLAWNTLFACTHAPHSP